jgi:NADPH:quinone reductase-like Zn-dependent oxidoreductase
LPSRLGCEGAGTIEAVGPGVDPAWIGKKVATIPGYSQNQYGCLSEDAIVPVDSLHEYPAKLSSIEGAAIRMQHLTAYGAPILFRKVGPGDFVIVTAASSSVGLAAIQLAWGEGLGADHVIATGEEDLPKRVAEITGGKGARVIFDPMAGRDPKLLKTATEYICDCLQDGRLKPKIAKTFPFAQSADAYRYLESNEQIGKVVITV